MRVYAPNTKKGSRRAGEKNRVGKTQKSAARQAAKKELKRRS